MVMVSALWVIVAFVVGVLVAMLIAWLFWQPRAAELEQDASSARAELDRRSRLLQQQEVTIDQLEARVREGELRRRDLEGQIAECRASVERLEAELAGDEGRIERVQQEARKANNRAADLSAAQNETVRAVQASTENTARDDLRRVEGIGPRISELLNQAGIHTFVSLAGTSVERLAQILQEAGIRLADATTWPQQASLAAEARWDELQALQDRLQGGRLV